MDTSIIYKDRNNSFSITLKKNGILLTPAELSSIVKFEFRYKGKYYDSVEYPDSFIVDYVTATVLIKPEPFKLDASSRKGDVVEFLLYDEITFPQGVMWDQFVLVVKDDAALIV